MRDNDSAIIISESLLSDAELARRAQFASAHPHQSSLSGVLFGLLGTVAFSFTVPFTHVAVRQLDPMFVGAARAVIAGGLAIALLALRRAPRPQRSQWPRLVIVACGVVVGFPLLTSYALRTTPASHAAVVVGLLPMLTAIVAVIRTDDRPGTRFWVAVGAGTCAAVGFITMGAGGLSTPAPADILLIGAIVAAAIGYAEGGMLARDLGAWQTICWALVLALPVTIFLTATRLTIRWPHAGASSWAALAYLGCISMFLAFFAWFHGLRIGPITRVSQVQLVQPVLTILWSMLLLDEQTDPKIWICAIAVVAFAAAAVVSRANGPRAR